jgi:phosphoglycerate dehydrogenase-like enzyme
MVCLARFRLLITGLSALLSFPAADVLAQQAQSSPAMVATPTGPVAGPLDVNTALQRFPLAESAKNAKELIPHWTLPKKIVVIVDTPARTAWLQEAMPSGVTVVGVPNDAAAQKELPDAYAFILANGDCGFVHGEGNADMFKNDPHLEWVHSASGGTDQCLISPQLANGAILLSNSQKVKSNALAESAYGFIFALARNMDIASANTHAGAFGSVRPTRPPKSLSGATMLVVGLGGSGTEVARIAHELGMTVIATRASGHDGPPYVEYVGLSDELLNLIGRADIVVVAAPLTPETKGMFNSAMFSRMKRGAMFVDFTRAPRTWRQRCRMAG